jgi:hypothetical protein
LSAAPHVFLSHASEDNSLAVRLAKDLIASGIDTFLDVWDITAGDSLRRRIDAGLGACTHFVVLLTPVSISKPWISAEIDAAFVQKILGRCKIVPVRYNLSYSELPPLLSALHSPVLDNYEASVPALIADLYGVSQKPEIGMPPAFIKSALPTDTGLSTAAGSLALCLIRRSEHGLDNDPRLSIEELQQQTNLPKESVVDAAFELEEWGLVTLRRHLNAKSPGFDLVQSTARLFVAFDGFVMTWKPEEDALQIAARVVLSDQGVLVETLANDFCWSTRRINPAINYLEENDLVKVSEMMAHPFAAHSVSSNDRTRRWVKSRSQ